MLFQETDTPGVYLSESGEMWPLGADMVTQLRNSGNTIVPRNASGGGNGLDPRGRSVQAVPAAAGGGALGGAPPMGPPTPSRITPNQQSANLPPRPVPPGLDPRGRSVQAVPGAAQQSPIMPEPQEAPQPTEGKQNLQRVLPRERNSQSGPTDAALRSQTPDFVYRPGSPGGWVDTARQTSGWSPEQQDEMRQEAMKAHQLRQSAANMQYEAKYREYEADKFRAEADKARFYNERLDEQRKLDTQNLYIEAQQKKIGERLKAARESSVDPMRSLTGKNTFAGVLAVLGASLGQYASGINGGPNNALAMMNNIIDRDVNEQLRLIAEAKEGAMMDRDELSSFQFRNDEEKKALIRAAKLEERQAELASIAADKSLVQLHPMAAQMQAALEEQKNQDLATINSAISRTAGERYAPPTAGGMALNPAKAAEAKLAEQNANIYESNRRAAGLENARGNIAPGELEIRSPTTGDVIGKAPTGERAQKANERIAALEAAEWTLDRMEELRNTEGFWRSEEAKAKYESYAGDLKDSSWAATRSDAPSEIESEEHKAKFGGLALNQFRQGKQSTQLKVFRQLLRQKAIPQLRQEGVALEYLRQRLPDRDEGNAD